MNGLFIMIYIAPSKSCSNSFLEPTSTKQWG